MLLLGIHESKGRTLKKVEVIDNEKTILILFKEGGALCLKYDTEWQRHTLVLNVASVGHQALEVLYDGPKRKPGFIQRLKNFFR